MKLVNMGVAEFIKVDVTANKREILKQRELNSMQRKGDYRASTRGWQSLIVSHEIYCLPKFK